MRLLPRQRGIRIVLALLILALPCMVLVQQLYSPRQFEIVPLFPLIRPPAMVVESVNDCADSTIEAVSIPITDVLPCYTMNDYIYTVHAMSGELKSLVARPRVFVRVGKNGQISDLKLLRSSGNERVDQRALETIRQYRHKGNNCVRCGAITSVNIDWNGPLWFREN